MRPVIHSGNRPFFAMNDITCYVLHGSRGDLLIDTGLPTTWRETARWLSGFSVKYVLLTHAHADHDWNAAKLQRMGAKILLHERDADLRGHFLSQRQRPTRPQYRLRTAVQAMGGAWMNAPHYEPDIWLGDDRDALRALGFDADLIALPGHTLGSVGLLHGQVLYCGDAFTGYRGAPLISPNVYDIDMMCASLEKILSLHPKWLACGHGLPVRTADAAPVIRAYLRDKTSD